MILYGTPFRLVSHATRTSCADAELPRLSVLKAQKPAFGTPRVRGTSRSSACAQECTYSSMRTQLDW